MHMLRRIFPLVTHTSKTNTRHRTHHQTYITEYIGEAIVSNDFYNINLYLEGIQDEWMNE